jgi:LuxR family transcriptional regulator, maltose regulon positive regulatory protein
MTGMDALALRVSRLEGTDLNRSSIRIASTEQSVATGSEPVARDLYRLCRHVLRGPQQAGDTLDRVERVLAVDQATGKSHHCADLMAVRAAMLAMEDDTLSAWSVAEHARRRSCSGDLARLAGLVVRYCAWHAGAAWEPDDVTRSRVSDVAIASERRSRLQLLVEALDLTLSAAMSLAAGAMADAEFFARRGLLCAAASRGSTTIPAILLARVHYEQGQLEEAKALLRSRLEELRTVGSIDAVAQGYALLARTAAHDNDPASAFALLDNGCALAEERDWPRLLAALVWERIRLCSAEDKVRAEAWLAQLQRLALRSKVPARCARSRIGEQALRAEIHCFVRFGSGMPPHDALARLHQEADMANDLEASAWVRLAEAQVLWVQGDKDRGLGRLLDWLRIAKGAGFRQQAIDAGAPVAEMLGCLVKDGRLNGDLIAFALCLADAFRCRTASVSGRARRTRRAGLELTKREQDVLASIGEGRTNKAIAQSQGVAPETIKTHVKSIFVKLGVERRAQAVAKAQRLGFLGT